jgi:hypothetical protein
MTPSADELAQRIGARLGALAWCATVGLVRIAIVGLRMTFVVTLLAAIWHAIVPGMAFGAWAVIFVAVYLVDKPLRCASRAIRRTIRRIACVGRARWMRRVRGNVAN